MNQQSSTKRCAECNKKTKLDFFTCPCSTMKIWCAHHKFPHTHKCTFNHREVHSKKIAEDNPKCVAPRVQPI